ncbi:hypothetical protein [Sphingomonas faeni]|uniref:hypothetical protein n=1 Tax=Sphingomonas faeni TaxID=185950 RepID=UPI002780EC8F|nr:hypothetical protein [Sphingomonas faeni]MDQ0836973.1 hypothetical protein [Sphingomonas faeni]
MMDVLTERSGLAVRSSSALDRIENLYLKVLRAALLIVATVLLVCALAWAAYSLSRVVRSPASVVEQPSVVSPSELVEQGSPSKSETGAGVAGQNELRAERAYYDGFVKRYYALFRTKYQPSLRADDKRLTIGEFDDLTINSAGRLNAIRDGSLNYTQDKRDLDAFLPVITEASSSKQSTDQLGRYRTATKRAVTTQVQRTRSETRRGWDTMSQSCEDWYESPIGCAVTRSVDVPYNETVTVMRYPDGISSPGEVMKGYQDRYFQLLSERRTRNESEASSKREAIVEGQVAGWHGLSQSVLLVGGFLTLMFFFLLVAIERHQRRQTTLAA